jgi:hypothetical protein
MGLSAEILQSIDKSQSTTLRFEFSDSCQFVKSQTVNVSSKERHTGECIETSEPVFARTRKSLLSRIVKRVKEYHWEVNLQWEVSLFSGTGVADRKILQSRSVRKTIVTQSKKPPFLYEEHHPVEVSLNWLLQQIDTSSLSAEFRIDTQLPSTRTPSRNDQVESALAFFASLTTWNEQVAYHCINKHWRIVVKHNPAARKPNSSSEELKDIGKLMSPSIVFCPIQPLMEDRIDDSQDGEKITVCSPISSISVLVNEGEASPILSSSDLSALLGEQLRTLEEASISLQKTFREENSSDLVSITEANLVLLCRHSEDLTIAYAGAIRYVEDLLKKQLIAAIGKAIKQDDIDQFVKFHNSKLLRPSPLPFCHAIRRPEHYPEGSISIEGENETGKFEPVETFCREVKVLQPVKVPLNAATFLDLTGKVFLHGWLRSRFKGSAQSYKLTARARQFSSFVLMVGAMTGPTKFSPQDVIIVENKDEVLIPLLLDEIPSPKEFKDAIRSLSLEQQRFAKSFRHMQLESSMFGVCVIQIKPQLERLLGLPTDSLTKEVQLTQDLMEVFVEYQVPSDLFSFDGTNPDATSREKVDIVKGHVASLMEVVDKTKRRQLEETTVRADMAGSLDERIFGRAGGLVLLEADDDDRCFTFLGDDHFCLDGAVGESITISPALNLVEDMGSTLTEPSSEERNAVNFTQIPKLLDSAFGRHDKDGSVRSTTIKTSTVWSRKREKTLLSTPEEHPLDSSDIRTETSKAFDLLDALSRSGSLAIASSELHIIVSATHRFENDVMGTIIEDNINPIEKLERSIVILASTIHGVRAGELIRDEWQLGRLAAQCQGLLEDEVGESQSNA